MKKRLVGLVACAMLLVGCGGEDVPSRSVSTDPAARSEARSGAEASSSAPEHGDVEAPQDDSELVVIQERLFIAQTNDMYINYEDYEGKTIQYEGIFKTAENADTGELQRFVIRYGPGCCGYDGEAGFEVMWDGEWPQEDDWVQVTGVLETERDGTWIILRLKVTSLEVKQERGAEFVRT